MGSFCFQVQSCLKISAWKYSHEFNLLRGGEKLFAQVISNFLLKKYFAMTPTSLKIEKIIDLFLQRWMKSQIKTAWICHIVRISIRTTRTSKINKNDFHTKKLNAVKRAAMTILEKTMCCSSPHQMLCRCFRVWTTNKA